jgi:ribonuclease HI
MNSSTPATWLAFCDGSAAPNPGRMAYGVLIVAPDGVRHTVSESAGSAVGCNNEAELMAIDAALQALRRLGAQDVLMHSDNSVVVAQLQLHLRSQGEAAPAIVRLEERFEATRGLLQCFARARVRWIPRHRNAEADALAREAAGLPPKAVLAPGLRRRSKARRKNG